ncbi:MAG TPA: DUF473 domain-containing protein [Methanosarcinales archaeon]|nr:DUF473 domain-containing protein [Methanosarcinales archaeon]
MKYLALTGIANKVIYDLRDHVLRTIEIRSPHNFFTALRIKAGDMVFLTNSNTQDVTIGTIGIIAQVRNYQIVSHKTIQSSEFFYEEIEAQLARIQLETKGLGRVRKIECCQLGEPTIVEADRVIYYDAR